MRPCGTEDTSRTSFPNATNLPISSPPGLFITNSTTRNAIMANMVSLLSSAPTAHLFLPISPAQTTADVQFLPSVSLVLSR